MNLKKDYKEVRNFKSTSAKKHPFYSRVHWMMQ